MAFDATLTSELPIALDINGTVLEALGFTSIMYTTSSFTANCIFIRPKISNSLPILMD